MPKRHAAKRHAAVLIQFLSLCLVHAGPSPLGRGQRMPPQSGIIPCMVHAEEGSGANHDLNALRTCEGKLVALTHRFEKSEAELLHRIQKLSKENTGLRRELRQTASAHANGEDCGSIKSSSRTLSPNAPLAKREWPRHRHMPARKLLGGTQSQCTHRTHA